MINILKKCGLIFLFIPLVVLNSCCVNSMGGVSLLNTNIVKAETSDTFNQEHSPLVGEDLLIRDGELRDVTKLKRNIVIKTDSINPKDVIDQAVKEEEIKAEEIRLLEEKTRAYEVAQSLVGYGGNCLYIANLFIQRYFGEEYSIGRIYQVDKPLPGDVMYYSNGGLGIEHWAIYLDENTSLQGNFNGVAIIYPSLYLNFASLPIYYRVY